MAYVVAEPCIKCKYTDCVEVCPVDCFYEGPNFLVIHPDECIDCGACEPDCPTKAIFPEESLPAEVERVHEAQRRPLQDLAEHLREEGRAAGRRPVEGRRGEAAASRGHKEHRERRGRPPGRSARCGAIVNCAIARRAPLC